jgi:hypothetical protein
MNRDGNKRLMAKQFCAIAILVSLVAALAGAQTPAAAPTNDDRGDTTSGSVFVFSSSGLSASGITPVPAFGSLANLDERVSREFDLAWRYSGDGTTSREGAVLIFRMADGSYKAELQRCTNEYKKCTFEWNPAAIAIVHTHPNDSDPRPAEQDKQVADKYGVPNFTLTLSGMYVYDPATKKTSKVLNGLDWLNLSLSK